MNIAPEVRFLNKISIDDSGCWNWTAEVKKNGYGAFYPSTGISYLAHRWSYEFHKGPIPVGLVIDHLCRNRKCVNPEHLEAVTQGENLRRGDRKTKMTHCKYGHLYSGENVGHSSGGRYCKTCHRLRQRVGFNGFTKLVGA